MSRHSIEQFIEYCQSDELSEEGLGERFDKYFSSSTKILFSPFFLLIEHAYRNERVTTGIVRCLLQNIQTALDCADQNGMFLLHCLCQCKLDDNVALEVLAVTLKEFPEQIRLAGVNGNLPIHVAASVGAKSPEFCRMLIQTYPSSVRMKNPRGFLPLHLACQQGTVETAQYLLNLYTPGINVANDYGGFPIHCAVNGLTYPSGDPDTVASRVELLLACDPDVVVQERHGIIPLSQVLCEDYNGSNIDARLKVTKLLIDASIYSICHEGNDGRMPPLHILCANRTKFLDEEFALKALRLLLDKYPEAARHAPSNSSLLVNLPIHVAAGVGAKSPEFCRLLVNAYPGSEWMATRGGFLPLHLSCLCGTFATAEYFINLHPESINKPVQAEHEWRRENGMYPIHCAIYGQPNRTGDDQETALKLVELLVACDPEIASQKFDGKHPIIWACLKTDKTKLEAGLKIIKLLYDIYPEAILEQEQVGCMYFRNPGCVKEVEEFIISQVPYANQVKCLDITMSRPDESGRLPSRTTLVNDALVNNAPLGTIKLFVKGYSSAIQTSDINGALPLHIACQYHESASVVDYLLGLEGGGSSLTAVDLEDNTALHYACRGAKYDTIALLLEKYDAVSVSKLNVHGKLPIHLLWEIEEGDHLPISGDGESITDSIFRLLRANPDMMVIECSK